MEEMGNRWYSKLRWEIKKTVECWYWDCLHAQNLDKYWSFCIQGFGRCAGTGKWPLAPGMLEGANSWPPLLATPPFWNVQTWKKSFPHLPPDNNNKDLGLILYHHTCKFYKVPARVQTSCLNSLKMNTPDNPLGCSRWVDTPERTVAESLSWTPQVLKKPKLTYVKFSRHFSGRFIRASIYSHCVPRHFRYIVVVDSLNSLVVNYTTCDSIYQPPSKRCFQLRQ